MSGAGAPISRPGVAVLRHRLFAALFAVVWTGVIVTAGCSIAQTPPPRPKPIRDVAHEDTGEVVTVKDTRLDLSTGNSSGVRASTPAVGVGPLAVRVPVTVGGEKKLEVPAEEITVRLNTGKLVTVVQELSSPPFAPGERVRVQHERVDDGRQTGRVRVVRE
jgi:hypothetical protein